MAFFVRMRKYDAEGPVYLQMGPFATEEVAKAEAQPLADQAAPGMVVTVEPAKTPRKKKANPKPRVKAAPKRKVSTKKQVAAAKKKSNPRPSISSAMDRIKKKKPVKARSAVTRAIVAEAKKLVEMEKSFKRKSNPLVSGASSAHENSAIVAFYGRVDGKLKKMTPKQVQAVLQGKEGKCHAMYAVPAVYAKEGIGQIKAGWIKPFWDLRGLLPLSKPEKEALAALRKVNPGVMLAAKAAAKKALPVAKRAAIKLAPHAKKAAADALEKAVKQLRANRRKKVK